MELTILCDVVDNFGDIGFVYRLARNLCQLRPQVKLNLVVSNLYSFSKIEPKINPALAVQTFADLTIFDWNNADFCKKEFSANLPKIIVQCFQCRRPLWLEEILFAKENKSFFYIINLEYLTAESWADDFHLLKSGTRSSFVKKINFFPGFTSKTGGLVLDKPFIDFAKERFCALKTNRTGFEKNKNLLAFDYLKNFLTQTELEPFFNPDTFCVSFFTYQRNCDAEMKALFDFENFMKTKNPRFKIHIFVSPGLSKVDVESSPKKFALNFTELKYLPQQCWDAFLSLCDFNFVRGEDSFSRSCLLGIPFVWHAYVQEDEFQLVKVDAFLRRLEPFFAKEIFADLKKYFLNFNLSENAEISNTAIFKNEALCEARDYVFNNKTDFLSQSEILFGLLKNYSELEKSYFEFAQNLISNGNLTENLLKLISSL